MTKLYTMDISFVRDSDLELLSRERKDRAMRYVFDRDRKLSIAASMLIARGLEEYGLREKDVVYGYTEYGKPYFRDYPFIHFSVSHSSSMAAVAFSSAPVGCDIEYLRPYDEDVAKMCFTLREREYILSSDDTAGAFTRIWSIKESFLKALGLGLVGGMNKFNVEINGDEVHIEENFDRKKWKINTEVVDNHFISLSKEDCG